MAEGGNDLGRYQAAIASIESGGNYGAVGPVTANGDRAYGKYQVMGNNIGPWSQAALGQALSPQEFLNNPEAQDAVFNHRFGGYVAQYGNPQDAASLWFTGRPLAQGANRRDILGTTGSAYVDKFNRSLAGIGSNNQPVAGADGATGILNLPPLGGDVGSARNQTAQLRRAAQVDTDRLAALLLSPYTPDVLRTALLNRYLPSSPAKRQIIQGADGYQYFVDTGERVLPGVTQTADPTDLYTTDYKNFLLGQQNPAFAETLVDQGGGENTFQENYDRSLRDPVFAEVWLPTVLPDFEVKLKALMDSNPGITRDQGIKHVLGLIGTSTNPVTGRRAQIDEVEGTATPVDFSIRSGSDVVTDLNPPSNDLLINDPEAAWQEMDSVMADAIANNPPEEISRLFGLTGVWNNLYAIGAGTFDDTNKGTQTFERDRQSIEAIAKSMLGALAQEVTGSGRTTNWVLQLLSRQFPETGSIFETAPQAKAKLIKLRDELRAGLRRSAKNLENPNLPADKLFQYERDHLMGYRTLQKTEILLSRFGDEVNYGRIKIRKKAR